MGGRSGLLVKRCIEEALDEFGGERRFASGTRLIAESVEAGLGEALSPQDDGLAVDAEFAANGVVSSCKHYTCHISAGNTLGPQ